MRDIKSSIDNQLKKFEPGSKEKEEIITVDDGSGFNERLNLSI